MSRPSRRPQWRVTTAQRPAYRKPPARVLRSTSTARAAVALCARWRAFAQGGATPPQTPPPLPPHATDTCSRCSQVIQSGGNVKITIFNIFFTTSPGCTRASFAALFGGRFWVALRIPFACFCSWSSDFWRKPLVRVQLRMLRCFVLRPGSIYAFRFRSDCRFVPCRMCGPGARYRSWGQICVNIYGI